MDKGNEACIHNGVLFSDKEDWSHVIGRKISGIGDLHIKRSKPDSERQL
jgi:hypothetical protein